MKQNPFPKETEPIFLCASPSILNHQKRLTLEQLIRFGLNWQKIISLGLHHECLPIIYYTLKEYGLINLLPEPTRVFLEKAYYLNLNRNMRIEKEIFCLLGCAAEEKIPIIPLKGFSLWYLAYDNPALRPIADVDLLITVSELLKIKALCQKLGYRETTIASQEIDYRHMALFSKKIAERIWLRLEFHGKLAYPRPYEPRIPSLWERAKTKEIAQQNVLFLSPEDTLLSLVFHLRSHTRRLNLKFIIDIAALINKHSDTLGWDYIIAQAQKNHIVNALYFFLYLTRELLLAKVPEAILRRIRPSRLVDACMQKTMNRRNFLSAQAWQGVFARLLIFDQAQDLPLYFWRVLVLERRPFMR